MNRLSHQEKIYGGLVDWNLPFYFSHTNESYRVYGYKGALSNLDMGVVLMCWNEEHPMEPK